MRERRFFQTGSQGLRDAKRGRRSKLAEAARQILLELIVQRGGRVTMRKLARRFRVTAPTIVRSIKAEGLRRRGQTPRQFADAAADRLLALLRATGIKNRRIPVGPADFDLLAEEKEAARLHHELRLHRAADEKFAEVQKQAAARSNWPVEASALRSRMHIRSELGDLDSARGLAQQLFDCAADYDDRDLIRSDAEFARGWMAQNEQRYQEALIHLLSAKRMLEQYMAARERIVGNREQSIVSSYLQRIGHAPIAPHDCEPSLLMRLQTIDHFIGKNWILHGLGPPIRHTLVETGLRKLRQLCAIDEKIDARANICFNNLWQTIALGSADDFSIQQARTCLELGREYGQKGGASAGYQSLLTVHVNAFDGRATLGTCLERLERARVDFDALPLWTGNFVYYLERSQLYFQHEKQKEALRSAFAVVALAPLADHSTHRKLLGELARKNTDPFLGRALEAEILAGEGEFALIRRLVDTGIGLPETRLRENLRIAREILNSAYTGKSTPA